MFSMFNKVIGQSNVINLLKHDINNVTLNNSILFYGAKFSGKLKTALELTRILNCLKDKEDNCSCSNCVRINNLDFEGLIFLSRRNFLYLLKEYISSYLKSNNIKYLLDIKKNIKLFTLPLQDFLINNTFSEQDKKDLSSYLERISTIFENNIPDSNDLEKMVDVISLINGKYKSENIPVDTIRSMLDWTYINQPDINRVIIIDHVDHLEKSSQNILLKRLEEPSRNLFFILIAENKNRIAQTILSRCRLYYFNNLKIDSVKEIINQTFGAESYHNSIYNFLTRNEETSRENILPVINKLLNLVFQKEAPFSDLSLFLNTLKDRKYVKALLVELTAFLEKDISGSENVLNSKIDFKIFENHSEISIDSLKTLLLKKANLIEDFGLNSILLLEGIFYPLKAMAAND